MIATLQPGSLSLTPKRVEGVHTLTVLDNMGQPIAVFTDVDGGIFVSTAAHDPDFKSHVARLSPGLRPPEVVRLQA